MATLAEIRKFELMKQVLNSKKVRRSSTFGLRRIKNFSTLAESTSVFLKKMMNNRQTLMQILVAIGVFCGASLIGCQPLVSAPSPNTAGLSTAIQKAFSESRDAVVAQPMSPVVWGHFGKLCMAHDFANDAMTCFQQASKLDKAEGKWSYFQGILLEEYDLEASEWFYRETLKNEKQSSVARYRLGQVLTRLGRLNEARAEFQAAAELKPQEPAPRLALARLDLAKSDWSAAEQNLKLASTLAPYCRNIYLELARLAARQGNWTEAVSHQNSAELTTIPEVSLKDPWLKEVTDLELAGQNSSERADQLLAAGQFADAAKMLQTVVRDHPELARARLNLAIVLWQLGRIPESQREFQQLTTQFSDDPTAYLTWGRLLASIGRFQEAKRRLEQAIERKGDAAEANSMLGMFEERQGNLEQAAKFYQRAVQAAPEVASTYLALAGIYRQLGEPSQANHTLEKAMKLKSTDENVRREIERQLREAIHEPDSASALNPANLSPSDATKSKYKVNSR